MVQLYLADLAATILAISACSAAAHGQRVRLARHGAQEPKKLAAPKTSLQPQPAALAARAAALMRAAPKPQSVAADAPWWEPGAEKEHETPWKEHDYEAHESYASGPWAVVALAALGVLAAVLPCGRNGAVVTSAGDPATAAPIFLTLQCARSKRCVQWGLCVRTPWKQVA